MGRRDPRKLEGPRCGRGMARQLSDKTGIPFSTEGFSIDPKTKRAVHQRSYEGEYSPRTSACEGSQDCITIERSSAYSRFTPDLFIIVGAVVDDDAPESFAKYRELVPDTYVKFSPLKGDPGGYGATSQCMDWDVIVLARTRLLSEAEAIAEAVSKLSGIPYAPRTPKPDASDYYSGRKGPYPNISVESDNAYGESGDSPYFLVVGGDLSEPEAASLDLLNRYKAIVPNTYRMKRARHVCLGGQVARRDARLPTCPGLSPSAGWLPRARRHPLRRYGRATKNSAHVEGRYCRR